MYEHRSAHGAEPTEHRERAYGNGRGTRRTAALFGLACLAACQTHEPRPLAGDAHREAWHGLRLEDLAPGDIHAGLAPWDGADADRSGTASDASDPSPDSGFPIFDPTDGLSLEEGRLLALRSHPDLRLARLAHAGTHSLAEASGLRPDPELAADLLYVTDGNSDPWVFGTALSISIPLTDRLDAERAAGRARVEVSRRALRRVAWTVWNDVERAWIAWAAARARAERETGLLESLEPLVASTTELANLGELPRSEADLFVLERARREIGLERLRGESAAAEQELRAALGLAPGVPLELLPHPDHPSFETPPGELDELGELVARRNPDLGELEAKYQLAEEELRLAIAGQLSDLVLGPRVESDEGSWRIGMLGALPLPVWNGNRVAIVTARAERDLARERHAARYEELVGELAVGRTRHLSLIRECEQLEEQLLPLALEQLGSAIELLRLGEGSSVALLGILTRVHGLELELVDRRAAEAAARVELRYLIGPALSDVDDDPSEGTH